MATTDSKTLSSKTIEVVSPVDGSRLGSIDVCNAEAVDQAVKRAEAAFADWSQIPVKERVQPLYRFKQLVETHIEELARLVTAENGKTIAESEAGIRKGLEVVEFAAACRCSGKGASLKSVEGSIASRAVIRWGLCAGSRRLTFRQWSLCGCSRLRLPPEIRFC